MTADVSDSKRQDFLWMAEMIKELIKAEYTGKVEINFFKGGINHAVRSQRLVRDEKNTELIQTQG